jgi:hypothetical protein
MMTEHTSLADKILPSPEKSGRRGNGSFFRSRNYLEKLWKQVSAGRNNSLRSPA